MFERYTEAARRLILHARNEAIRCNSPVVETEHFLLALLQECNGLLPRLLPAEAPAIIENELRRVLPSNSASQQTDASFSHDMKRVLAYGAEAADRLCQTHIDSVHSLLGLLKEENCRASRILEKHGITRKRVLREIGVRDWAPDERPCPRPTREILNALVASLPEEAMEQACRTLEHLQVWPPLPSQKPARIAEIQKEMRERFRAGIRPGQGMMGGGGGSWTADAQGRLRDGAFSSSRIEDGVRVTETHRFFAGHEITIIERLRINGEGTKLSYSQQLHGLNREHHFEIDFDIG